jgi:cysteine-S-conjugate beta-lyase
MRTAFAFDRAIDRIGTGSAKWSHYGADVLPMWVADMDFAVAPEIAEAIRDRLAHPVLGYSIAGERLRQRIVEAMAARYGWPIQPDEIVFLPGVEPGFNMALKALTQPGDSVCVQTPMYRPMLAAPDHWGLRRIDVDLKRVGDRYASDPDQLAAALAASSAFLFCNPHNPTGTVFARPELETLAALCLRDDVWIVSDEIHCDLAYDGRRHVPIASLSPEVAKRTVTLMAASKTFNIAGLKTAFAIIQDARLRERFAACRLGMVDSVNALGLVATEAAYAHGWDWHAAAMAYLQGNRDYLAQAVQERLPGIAMVRPEATFLAWLDCAGLGIAGDPQLHFLDKARVAFSAGGEFGAAGATCVRLNFGCTRRTLEECIERMAAVV